MIGVSLNYRLSAFGFPCGKQAMDAGATNLGFKDQSLALRWVNENIGAFGGAPDKITIWGEGSGAESVSAQTLAYGGRDDGLFHGVIAESGYLGFIARSPGNFNSTDLMQETDDRLARNTSCRATVGTPASLECLHAALLEELNQALNVSAIAEQFPLVLDGDFIADYPSNQFRDGTFPKVRLLIAYNTDEGSSFDQGFSPYGGAAGLDTDDQIRTAIASIIGPDVEKTVGKTADKVVDELMALYPNMQAVSIPSLDKWPIIQPGNLVAQTIGVQYRRAAALFGDL